MVSDDGQRDDGARAANWFIALPVRAEAWWARVPDPPRRDEESLCARLHEDDLHLTIAFLGAVAEDAARRAWDAFAWPLGPTRVTLGRVVAMGDEARPSAFSALLDEGRDAIEGAMGATRDSALELAGGRRELRAPKAHVTVARPRRRLRDDDLARAKAWADAIDLGRAALHLDRVALYTWARPRVAGGRAFAIAEQRALG